MRSSKNELAGRFQSIVEELAGVQPKKFKSKYYPSTAMPVRPHKKVRAFPARKKRTTTSARAKPNEESDGEPDHVPHMLFMNCTVNMVPSAGGKSAIATNTRTDKAETLDPRRKASYLKLLTALCGMNKAIDPAGRETVGILKNRLDLLGFTLSEDTIKDILKEVQDIQTD